MMLIDLELEDFLDPSLPRMYSMSDLRVLEAMFSDEFTQINDGFLCTTVLPPFHPPSMLKGEIILKPRS